MDEKIHKLAKKISEAGKEIAKDKTAKDYYIGYSESGNIIVASDSGYEAVYIGNINTGNTDGFMCLYTNNTSCVNSFPPIKKIAELLQKVVQCEKLPEGEGMAAYYDWKEFGGMEKQLRYFSEVVKKFSEME